MKAVKTLFQHPRAAMVLLLSMALVVVMSVFLAQRLDTLNESGAWVAHSERVRLELARVLESLIDLGAGVASFPVTHDPDSFAPAERANAAIPGQLESLMQLLSDDGGERPFMDALVLLAKRRQVQSQELRMRVLAGDAEAEKNAVIAGEGKSLMIASRSIIAQLEAAEERTLALHRKAAARAYQDALATVEASAVAAVLLLLVVTLVTLRDGERRREIEEQLATTLRSIGDAVISTDAAGAVRFMNNVAQHLTGWTEGDARGRPLAEVFKIINENTRATVESPVSKVLREGNIVNLANHTLLIAKDGTERPIEDSGAPVFGKTGELSGVVLVFRDATAERSAKMTLQQSDERFKAAVAAVAGVIWTNTAEGEMRGAQPAWEALTGQSFAQYQGFGWSSAVHPNDSQPTIDAWLAAVRERRAFNFEHRLLCHDGEWRLFSVRAIPLLDPQGTLREWVGVHTDITEQRGIEQALRATEGALRTANARKDDFLATLSHELRNPLAPIRSAARLLSLPRVTPAESARSMQIITRQVAHMASLLDDLMDVARITRGVLLLKPERTALLTILETAIESARPALEAKHHVLETSFPDPSLMIHADPVRLTQVVVNLLTNAAKYTEVGGRVGIGVRLGEEEIGIYVRDTGIGIDGSMLGQVFEMFAQVQPATERSEGGLGIGLGLVKGLVELHGGRIEASSPGVGKGSEFNVFLPGSLFTTEDTAGLAGSSREQLTRSRTVLIADDNEDAAESLGMLLEMSGHQVAVANTGPLAVTKANMTHPDVVILDIGMPGMSGYEVAKSIRKEAWAKTATLIAVTGWGQEDDKRKAAEAGFDHHLTKPVDPGVLERLIEKT